MESLESNKDDRMKTNDVIVQVYPPLADEASLDVLRILLESKRQSGGGDLEQLELVTNNHQRPSLSLVRARFVDRDAKERVLVKRFLSFERFMMIAFDADRVCTGYRAATYELNQREVILSGDSPLDIDQDILQIYGENLQPGNEVMEVRKSSIFPHTITIVYENDLVRDLLHTRFAARSKIKNTHFKLVDSLRTNTILVAPLHSATKPPDFNSLKPKILDEANKMETRYFVDMSEAYFLLIVEESFTRIDDLIEAIRSHVDESNTAVELCASFQLVDEFFDNKLKPTNNNKPNETMKRKDKWCQTDLSGEEIARLLLQSSSTPIATSGLFEVKTAAMETTKKPTTENMRSITLDAKNQYTYGLLHSKQMFVCLQDVLKKPFPSVEIVCDREAGRITALNKAPSN